MFHAPTSRDFLAEGLLPAEAMIASLMDCQLAHINTSHPDFVGGSTAGAGSGFRV
jgi:dynamin 1-like protein